MCWSKKRRRRFFLELLLLAYGNMQGIIRLGHGQRRKAFRAFVENYVITGSGYKSFYHKTILQDPFDIFMSASFNKGQTWVLVGHTSRALIVFGWAIEIFCYSRHGAQNWSALVLSFPGSFVWLSVCLSRNASFFEISLRDLCRNLLARSTSATNFMYTLKAMKTRVEVRLIRQLARDFR